MKTANDSNFPSIEFQSTGDDFAAAYKLHCSPIRRVWLFLILLALVSCIVLFLINSHDKKPLWLQLSLLMFSLLGGTLGGFALWAFAVPWYGRHIYNQQPLAHLSTRIELRPEGLRFQSARGESEMLWRDFTKWRAGRKTTLLYMSPALFIHVPARLAALGFPINDLKAALTAELGPPIR
jgi:hypothetical protein